MAVFDGFNFFFDVFSSLPASQPNAPPFFPPFENFRSSPPYPVFSFFFFFFFFAFAFASASASAFSSGRNFIFFSVIPPLISLAPSPKELYPSIKNFVKAAVVWSKL